MLFEFSLYFCVLVFIPGPSASVRVNLIFAAMKVLHLRSKKNQKKKTINNKKQKTILKEPIVFDLYVRFSSESPSYLNLQPDHSCNVPLLESSNALKSCFLG